MNGNWIGALGVTTPSGFWDPLMLVAASVVVLVIAYAIRSRGRKSYKHGTDQTMPFFSGNLVPKGNIDASNLYWGFKAAMKKYYDWMESIHTGIVNDYVYAFVVVLVIMLLAVVMEVFA